MVRLTALHPNLSRLTVTRRVFWDSLCAIAALLVWLAIALGWVWPPIQALYKPNDDVPFAITHFNDARQYTFICIQGYDVATEILPTEGNSRVNWLPLHALLQCALHTVARVSLLHSALFVAAYMVAVALFFAIQTLRNLQIAQPRLLAWLIFCPIIGGTWLFLPSVEMAFYAIGLIVLYLVTLPPSRSPSEGLRRAVYGFAFGLFLWFTKPNALAMGLPLAFAFVYQSWIASQVIGYQGGLLTFAADMILAAIGPIIYKTARVFRVAITLESRPIRYEWAALTAAAGIGFGFAIWLWWTSAISGIPFFFLRQQSERWIRPWAPGDLVTMLRFYGQSFGEIGICRDYRLSAAWYLAAVIAALVPAASRRVPAVIRAMIPLTLVFLWFTGAAYNSDRYLASTAVIGIGWACWAAPIASQKTPFAAVRFMLPVIASGLLSAFLLFHLMPRNQPSNHFINNDASGVSTN